MKQADPDLSDLFGRRPRVVIGHPFLGRGGSEANVMWLVEALKRDCDITVMTTGGWDLDDLNRHYGTSVKPEEVTLRSVPMPPLPEKLLAAAVRGALFQRFARRIASEYDIRLSAYNPTDWGLPAIHFLADFTWNRKIRAVYDPPVPGMIYRDTPLRRAYLGFARLCESPSGRDPILFDRVVANSQWSATELRRHYPLPPLRVMYPPVWASFPQVPWSEKENDFVMIGRIAPEKRVEEAIGVLAALRQRGVRLRLHLCGRVPVDPYGKRVSALCHANREWIVHEGFISGICKANLLARCRYGLNMCASEAFGIAVAEMVKAGAIVFAPRDGGPGEILDDPSLLFADEAEAVGRIYRVLRSSELQKRLRTHLAHRAATFDIHRVILELRAYIAETLMDGRESERPPWANAHDA